LAPSPDRTDDCRLGLRDWLLLPDRIDVYLDLKNASSVLTDDYRLRLRGWPLPRTDSMPTRSSAPTTAGCGCAAGAFPGPN
jgi:hypothetical protein